jgi:hypothetical protein
VFDAFTYGPGIPSYFGIWVIATPVLVAGLAALRVRWSVVGVVVASTLPTLALHNPPEWLAYPLRYAAVVTPVAVVLAWVWWRLWRGGSEAGRAGASASDEFAGGAGSADAGGSRAKSLRWAVVPMLVVVALGARVPLAWLDPGISDFATSTEVAAEQMLGGQNPYRLPNPNATVGTYQYPIGTVLANAPFVAAAPEAVGGEAHLGTRAAVWATEAAVVALLAWAGWRLTGARVGYAAAFAYAAHPTLIRESGIVVANDLTLGLVVLASAVALALRRRWLAAVCAGLAISIKPSAAVLLPVVLLTGGWGSLLVAAALPAVLQAPWLLWPEPGLAGLGAIAEPTARVDPAAVLRYSTWYPLYAVFDLSPGAVRATAVTGVAASFAVAAWAGLALRRMATPIRVTAAYAAPFLVAFLLASVQRTNYQDWYLAPFLLCAVLWGVRSSGSGSPGTADGVRSAPHKAGMPD